jgi:hypothetical protein
VARDFRQICAAAGENAGGISVKRASRRRREGLVDRLLDELMTKHNGCVSLVEKARPVDLRQVGNKAGSRPT